MAHDRATLAQVAALHAAGLGRGFLSRLGPRFLTLLYEAIDTGPESVLLIEKRDGRVMGFVSGGAGMGPIYRRLLGRPFALALALAPHLLRGAMLRGMLELACHRGSRGDGETASAPPPGHELFSIVVVSAARGTGVAETLYRRLEAHFRDAGAEAFRIVVGEDLAPAHRFYRRMGAEPAARTQIHAGAGATIYVQRL